MGNVRYSDAVANAMGDAINTKLNAGSGAAKLRFYDGSQPAGPSVAITSQTLLAELTLSDPAAPPAASRVLTWSAVTQDSSANNNGTASWARVLDSDDVAAFDTDVGNLASSAGIKLNTTTIVSGAPVALTSLTITVPTSLTF